MSAARKTLNHPAAGFTLLEVVIAISILSLIIGGVMASVSACLQSTEIVRRERVQQARCDALQSFLEHSLLVLPADAVLRYSLTDARGDQPPPLRLRARQPSLVFSSAPWQQGQTCETEILFRRQANNSLTLGGAVTANDSGTFLAADTVAASSFAWTPLMPGIRDVKWRFYDRDQARWLERWEKEDNRPALVELSLTFADATAPFHGVFWIPSQLGKETSGQPNDGTNLPTAPTAP